MTTLAFMNGLLAADRQVTAGDQTIAGRMTKIRKIETSRGCVLACGSGQANMVRGFLDWVVKGMPENDLPVMHIKLFDDEPMHACGFVFYRPDRVVCLSPLGFDEMEVEYWADGSGADFAMAAMEAGANPIEAVRIAARRDLYTGEGVDWVALPGCEPEAPIVPLRKHGPAHDLLARPEPVWPSWWPPVMLTPAPNAAPPIGLGQTVELNFGGVPSFDEIMAALREHPEFDPNGARMMR